MIEIVHTGNANSYDVYQDGVWQANFKFRSDADNFALTLEV